MIKVKNLIFISSLLTSLSLALPAQACVVKSGKNCPSTVAHKVDHKVKLNKPGMVGGLGATVHTSAPVVLGQAGAATGLQVGPATEQVFYLFPETVNSDGRRTPAQIVSKFIVEHSGVLLNPDGSLTQHAIDVGWKTIVVKVPGQIVYPSVPTPAAVPSLQPPALAPAQPSINGHMQVHYHQLSPEKSKKLNKPGAHRGVVASYTIEQMRSQGLIDQTGRLTQRARQQGFATTITPLPGVQYYQTRNGQQVALNPQQVQLMIHGGSIGIDGALLPAAVDQGFSMVINRPAEHLPQQLAAQQPVASPQNSAMTQVPVPQTVQAPALLSDGKRSKNPVPDFYVQTHPNVTTLVRPADFQVKPYFEYILQWPSGSRTFNSGNVQRNPTLTNPDGTLTPYAIAKGWTVSVVGQSVPNMVPQPQAVPNLQAPPQSPAMTQVPVPQTVQAPNLVPQPHVAVYTAQHAEIRPHEQAYDLHDPAFHLVVVGFKEP
ncbi:MAG: hypothetical protein ACJA1U_001850 [Bermanella sp.]|jgi:hypothetical protein